MAPMKVMKAMHAVKRGQSIMKSMKAHMKTKTVVKRTMKAPMKAPMKAKNAEKTTNIFTRCLKSYHVTEPVKTMKGGTRYWFTEHYCNRCGNMCFLDISQCVM